MPCPFPEHHKSSSGDSGIGTIALAVIAVLVVGAVAGPVVAAAAELVHIVFITVAVIVVLAVFGGAALLAYRLRHRRQNGTPAVSFLGAVQPRPSGTVTAPRSAAALPPAGPRELHLHLHGISAQDVTEILGHIHREDG